MSAKSIKAFEAHTGGRFKPALQLRLRKEAEELRATAGHLLARAGRLEEMASELEGAEKK